MLGGRAGVAQGSRHRRHGGVREHLDEPPVARGRFEGFEADTFQSGQQAIGNVAGRERYHLLGAAISQGLGLTAQDVFILAAGDLVVAFSNQFLGDDGEHRLAEHRPGGQQAPDYAGRVVVVEDEPSGRPSQ